MNGPRLLFVLTATLGWKTYASQVEAAARARGDFSSVMAIAPPSLLHKLLIRRHNREAIRSRFRLFDPVTGYRGVVGGEIRRLIKRVEPDLVHFGPHWPAAAHAFSENCHIPFTAALDCTEATMNDLKNRANWSKKEQQNEADLLQRAARLFPMSNWTAQSLQQDYGVPSTRIEIIAPSIEVQKTRVPSPKAGPDAKPRILFVGNDFKRKGGDRLYAWATGPLREHCELHIVSSDPDVPGSSGNVVVHGRVNHGVLIDELMPSMDIMCLPTQSDMSTHVLVEAARAGLPCVTSDIGGLPDLVLEGKTGFLVDRADDRSFINRLQTLLDSEGLRTQMGQAAFELAYKKFNARINYNRLIDQLLEIAQAGAMSALPEPRIKSHAAG